jgi:predicted transcriptional regulator
MHATGAACNVKKKFPSPTKLDNLISQMVKEKRDALRISQDDLAYEIGVEGPFIGQCENPKHPSHYNITHLNQLAIFFECNLHDLIPKEPVILAFTEVK